MNHRLHNSASPLAAVAAIVALIQVIVGCGGGSQAQPNWCSDVTALQPPVSIAIGDFYADGGSVCVILEDKEQRWLALTHTMRAHMDEADTFVPNQLYIGRPEEVYDGHGNICRQDSLEATLISEYLVKAIQVTEASFDPKATGYRHRYDENETPEISAAKAILQGLHTGIPASLVETVTP